jgi:small conductance mechanosensitive channel
MKDTSLKENIESVTGDIDEFQQLALSFWEWLAPISIRFLIGIGILVIGIFLARKFSSIASQAFDKAKIDPALKTVLLSIIRYTIIIVALFLLLSQVGVETGTLIAVFGAAGLAIGLALQGTLANIASGVMLLILRPFKIGHHVNVADGIEGFVEKIDLFTTELVTFNNVYISIPNSKIWGTIITNYSNYTVRAAALRHFLHIDADHNLAMQIILNVLRNDQRVLLTPEPFVFIHTIGKAHIELISKGYVRNSEFWDIIFDLQQAIKESLDEAGIKRPQVQFIDSQEPLSYLVK